MNTVRALSCSLVLILSNGALADEGMWPFDQVPTATIKSRHGVTLTPPWLNKVQTSTVRLSGCTGSFVSAQGLILTNHHCVARCLGDLSTPKNDVLRDGIVTRDQKLEQQCATQIADVLVATQNITDKVMAGTRGLSEQSANTQRKKILTQLEQVCEVADNTDPKSGALKCEGVTLYNGGQYFLYKYKRYTDIRIVFAPEQAIAAFGGDPDNFQFPRWCLDMAILRAYENGKPVSTPNHLKINFAGPVAGEAVFVSGHPGATERLLTVSQLLERRDMFLPQWLLRASELRGRYIQFGKGQFGIDIDEARRIVQDPLSSLENSIKVRRKQLDALLNQKLFKMKTSDEAALRSAVAAKLPLASRIRQPWDDIERASKVYQSFYFPYTQIESGSGFNSQLFDYARALVRGTSEREKPNADRLREYVDARLPRLVQQLSAPTPVYPALEKTSLSFSLERMREWLGPDYPLVRQLLAKDSPDALASRLIDGSTLDKSAVRLRLWEGGATAVANSKDPMIEFARAIDAEARALRKRYEDDVEAPIQIATERVATARFAILGTRVSPDATFTLRLNDGTVQGWKENDVEIAPFTQLNKAFERATGADPFRIPDSWLAVKAQLNMATPFNLSTNNDIVGGNSGSPLINARGEIVGLMFDGNIHSISGSYWFDVEKNRAIAVHPAIMSEALQKVYRADGLFKELNGTL